jgi:hypothetical protein
MNIPYFKLFTILFIMACMIGVGSAADGDASRGDPSAANFSIDEPNSQTFNATIANADPTNKTFSVLWYKDSVLVQTSPADNLTYDTYTFVGGSATAGLYNITAITNASGTTAQWNMTVNNKIFSGITEVIVATVGILPDVVDLVVGIVPVLVTLAIVGLITGIFAGIILAIKRGM